MRGGPRGRHRSVDRGTCRQGIELRNNRQRSADAVQQSGRRHAHRRYREPARDSAQSETPRMYGHSARENRETPSMPRETGRLEKAVSRTSSMHVDGESDGRVLPTTGPNADDRQSAEAPEGRRPTKENTEQTTAPRTQSRTSASSGLSGVRGVARKDKQVRFTALLHHVTVGQLQASFYALKRTAAPGVDGVTWTEYETDLDARLTTLHSRVHQ